MQSLGILAHILTSFGLSRTFVVLPLVRGLVVERVVRVGLSQQALDGKQHRLHLEGRRPVFLQNVEADPAEIIWVRCKIPILGWYILVSKMTLGGDIG